MILQECNAQSEQNNKVKLNDDNKQEVFFNEMLKSRKDLDEALESAGAWGRAQYTIAILIILTCVPSAILNVSSIFIMAKQEFHCASNIYPNSTDSNFNISLTRFDSQCYSNVPSGLINDTKTLCQDGWVYDTTTFYSTAISQYDLVCEKERYVSMTTSLFLFGVFVGSILFGTIADRIGRLKAVLLAIVLQVVGGIAASLVNNFVLFIIFRFIVGMGSIGVFGCMFVLAIEIIVPRYRIILEMCTQTAFAIGVTLIGLMAYFIRNHIILQLATACSVSTLLLLYFIFPESPRWLLAKHKYAESEKVIRYIAKINGKILDEDFTMSKECIKFVNKLEDSPDKSKLQSHELNRLALITVAVSINWFVMGFVYYGLMFSIDDFPTNIFLMTSIMGLIEIPGNALAFILMKLYGRRKSLILLQLFSSISFLVLACLINYQKETEFLTHLTTSVACFGKCLISGLFAVNFGYTAELYPTTYRNAGVGIGSSVCRIGAFISPYVKLLSSIWKPFPFTIFSAICLCATLTALLLPESNKQLVDALDNDVNDDIEIISNT